MRALPALLLLAVVSASDTESPERRFTAKTTTFSSPGARGTYTFSGIMWVKGKRVGTVRMSAKPGRLEDKGPATYWEVREEGALGEERFSSWALLDRRLLARRGGLRQPGTELSWKRDDEIFHLLQDDDRRTIRHGVEVTSPIVGTLVLFARLALPEKGSFKVGGFFAQVRDNHFHPIEWQFPGEGDWLGSRATIVKCKAGDVRFTFGLDTKTRKLLGFRQDMASGTVWMLPKGVTPPTK